MRSFVKILLGIKVVIGTIYFFGASIYSIYFFIDANNIATKETLEVNQVYGLAWFLLITAIIFLIGGFIAFYTRNKLNDAYKKKELILPIILLYLSFGFISGSLILFTPSKKILSKHPYFE